MGKFHTTAPWKAARKAFITSLREQHGRYAPCHICNQPVDLDISGDLPVGPTVDHIESVEKRPDLRLSMDNLALAHRACNRDKQRRERRSGRPRLTATATSNVDWYGGIEHRDGCECHLSPTLNRSVCW